MSGLKQKYKNEVVSKMMKHFGYTSVMQVPKLLKISINMGLGEALNDKKVVDSAIKDMEMISGQKAVPTKARKSVAAFKVRTGWVIGCKVTLRGKKMYDFLERLIDIAIPRIRDFRGFSSRAFDGRGNYSLGITEQIIFPEIDFDKIDAIRGMDITINTDAKTDKEAWALLTEMNFPFKEKFSEKTK
jgi:large subunit ribosomal protein L5